MANKQRLIDANKLITDIQGTASEVAKTAPYSAEWFTRLHDRQCEIIEIIKGQATVDAVEVVHGHWTPTYTVDYWLGISEIDGFICSECGKDNNRKRNYCPNCGAKMDGGNEDV